MLTARQGPGNLGIGTSSAHSGVEAVVSWSEMDPRLARVGGPVDLTIQPFSPQESALGHLRFDSLESFKENLLASIVVEAPRRRILVGEELTGEITEIRLLSGDNRTARYFGSVAEDGGASIGLPDGPYFAYGTSSSGDDWVGELLLAGLSEATIRWRGRLPGETRLEVTLIDEEAQPIENLHVAYELVGETAGVHSGSSPRATDEFGVTHLPGLLPDLYNIYAFTGGARSRVLLGLANLEQTNQFVGILRERCSMDVVIRGGDDKNVPHVIDHGTCDVFASINGQDWTKAPSWQMFTNGRLSIDDLDCGASYWIAAMGDGYGGVSGPLSGGDETAYVHLHPLRLIEVAVPTIEGRAMGELLVRAARGGSVGGHLGPWSSSVVGADGHAQLRIVDPVGRRIDVVLYARDPEKALGRGTAIVGKVLELAID